MFNLTRLFERSMELRTKWCCLSSRWAELLKSIWLPPIWTYFFSHLNNFIEKTHMSAATDALIWLFSSSMDVHLGPHHRDPRLWKPLSSSGVRWTEDSEPEWQREASWGQGESLPERILWGGELSEWLVSKKKVHLKVLKLYLFFDVINSHLRASL